MLHLEFTIEPFVEGQPGPHVTSAIEAARSLGARVDIGPFGTVCEVAAESMPEVVAAVTAAALTNGATHITLHVETGGQMAGPPAGPPAGEPTP